MSLIARRGGVVPGRPAPPEQAPGRAPRRGATGAGATRCARGSVKPYPRKGERTRNGPVEGAFGALTLIRKWMERTCRWREHLVILSVRAFRPMAARGDLFYGLPQAATAAELAPGFAVEPPPAARGHAATLSAIVGWIHFSEARCHDTALGEVLLRRNCCWH